MDPLTLAAAVVVGVLGAARLTRLWTEDSWPPVAWLRSQYLDRAPSDWRDLGDCPFCAAPWIVLGTILWGTLSDLHWSWWLFHGWLGASYVAAMIVVRDVPE